MTPGATSGLAIGRVRVVDRHADALRARLAADRLLSAAQPGVPGLPAGATLIVRRLAGGGVGLVTPPASGASTTSLPSPLASPAAVARWRTAIEGKLVELWHGAARPAHGPVPGTVPAVLFDDHAELLACLAADWAAGVVAARWWWQALLRARPSVSLGTSGRSGWFPEVLRSHADEVPAVFELLARRRLAVRVTVAIPPRDALALALALAGEHGIRGARELVVRPVATSASADAPGEHPIRSPRSVSELPDRHGRAAHAPWRDFVPEAGAPGLDPAQRLLVGLALTIRRRPAVVRPTGFWHSVERWWREAIVSHREGEAGREARSAPELHARAPLPDGGGAALASLAVAGHEPQPEPRAVQRTAGEVHRPAASRPRHEHDAVPPASPWARHARDAASTEPGVWTAHAGVLYLLNVALFLGLYGDFTMPREPGLALDPWDFVALIARRLLGPTVNGDRRTLDGDPIWWLLADLAGHEGRPGAGFRAPRCWRVPPDWLAPFDRARGPWRWMVCHGRLRVAHPAGFVALDLPVRGETLLQLSRELVRYGSPRCVATIGDAGKVTCRGLARWTDWMAEYIRARLRIALGARSALAAVRVVLDRPGTVHITPTRVDVECSLGDLPVQIRIAGLDRSPGWIPAAGRHLAFHFA